MNGWEPSDRGVSFHFGADVLETFLCKNSLSLIVRAHQVVEDGYEFFNRRSLVTLFSAPNYCGQVSTQMITYESGKYGGVCFFPQFDNAGAIMSVSDDLTCSFTILPVRKKMEICVFFGAEIVVYFCTTGA